MRTIIRRVWAVLLMGLCLLMSVAGAENGYSENEWGYVEESMDPSGGIPENATGRLALIRDKGVLRVATEPYFPPQEFIDASREGQDQYIGSDMELARRIAQKMGVKLQILPMEFTRVLPAVAEGEADLAISGLSFTPGRAATTEMSIGYYFAGDDAGSVLLIRAEDKENISSLEALEGRNLVAQRGSLQETLLSEKVTGYHQFLRVPSVMEVYEAIADGRADAAVVDIASARAYIKEHEEARLVLVEDVVFRQEVQYEGDRVAARKGETQLIAFVNGVIEDLLRDGQYQKWFEEYMEVAARLGL